MLGLTPIYWSMFRCLWGRTLGTVYLIRAFLQFCSSEVEARESSHSPSFQAHTSWAWSLKNLTWAHCAGVWAGLTLHHWIRLQLVREADICFSWAAATLVGKLKEFSWTGNTVFQTALRKNMVLSQKEFTNWNHYLVTTSLLFVFKKVPLGLSAPFTHHRSTLFQTLQRIKGCRELLGVKAKEKSN